MKDPQRNHEWRKGNPDASNDRRQKRPKAYTLRAAADVLGVCHTTLRRWIADGSGPRTFIQPGIKRSTYRIMPSALEAFVNQNSKGGKVT